MSDRKYRQRGYQDDDRPAASRGSAARGPATGRDDALTGPRGRGVGRLDTTVFRCAVCGARQEASEVAADAVCASCGADLHTCTHCAAFDTGARFECRRPIAARVAAKAKRNACDLFAPKAARERAAPTPRSDDARAAFDALFKL